MLKIFFFAVIAAIAMASPFELRAEKGGSTKQNVNRSFDIGAMLSDLGFEPRDVSPAGDGAAFEIETRRSGRDIKVVVRFSTDGRTVRVEADLARGVAARGVKGEAYLQLLILNNRRDLGYFAAQDDRIYMMQSFDLSTVTPAAIRKAIDSLSSNAFDVSADWPTASAPATSVTLETPTKVESVHHLRRNPFQK